MKNNVLLSGLLGSVLISGCSVESNQSLTAPTSETDATSSSGAETTDAPTSADDPTTTVGGGEIVMCDPWAQDCPEGYKCMAYTDDGDYFTGTKCTPVAPNPGQVGDTCYGDGGWSTGVDDCALGLACWNINPETNIGACVAQCTGTMDDYHCPEEKDICVFWTPGIAHVCLQGCDPLLQDCPAGQGCGPDWAGGAENFVCLLDWSFEEGQEFDPCFSSNTCDPGLICWDPKHAAQCDQEAGCCQSFCALSNPSCIGENVECLPFYPPDVPTSPQYADVGICGLPI